MDFIPYSRQDIGEDDIAAVAGVLRSDWITGGPAVDAFEQAVCAFTGAEHAVAVSSGTAALHAAMHAIGVGPGDEVIVPAMTFVATANCVVYQGARPVFADVEAETLLIDPEDVRRRITPRTRAVIAVDYAGQPCDYDALREIASEHGLFLVADACHSLGAEYRGRKVGTLADLTVFSFHPVKQITTGEGGMIVTGNGDFARKMRSFRNHGIDRDARSRAASGLFSYEVKTLGHNYRITDFQCALGKSQLGRLPAWIAAKEKIAASYGRGLAGVHGVEPLALRPGVRHAWHLYVVRVSEGRDQLFAMLRRAGIGANVHYPPVHLHPYYRENFSTASGLCPAAEKAAAEILSLPMFPQMEEAALGRTVAVTREFVEAGA